MRFGFRGQTQVVNVGGRYAATDRLIFNAGLFWTEGFNGINTPPGSQTGADWAPPCS